MMILYGVIIFLVFFLIASLIYFLEKKGILKPGTLAKSLGNNPPNSISSDEKHKNTLLLKISSSIAIIVVILLFILSK